MSQSQATSHEKTIQTYFKSRKKDYRKENFTMNYPVKVLLRKAIKIFQNMLLNQLKSIDNQSKYVYNLVILLKYSKIDLLFQPDTPVCRPFFSGRRIWGFFL